MPNWKLKHNPIPPLLKCSYENIVYFTKRDLLNKKVENPQTLWDLKEATKIISKQEADGRWKYPSPKKDVRDIEGYDLLETYRQLGFLVEKFGFNKQHEAITKAKEYIFKQQTKEGDVRGIYWNQYSPNYTAGLLELFIKAGYENDKQVAKGLKWLLSMRQNDGGWVIPIRTHKVNLKDWINVKETLQPNKKQPFSYMVTGVVLRAFAYHKKHKKSKEIKAAAELVLSRMFKNDIYPDRKSADAWTRFSFPFWFTDLIAVLDPIAELGFTLDHPKVKEGIDWFINNQASNGTWNLHILKGNKKEMPYWMNLNICRLFKKFTNSND